MCVRVCVRERVFVVPWSACVRRVVGRVLARGGSKQAWQQRCWGYSNTVMMELVRAHVWPAQALSATCTSDLFSSPLLLHSMVPYFPSRLSPHPPVNSSPTLPPSLPPPLSPSPSNLVTYEKKTKDNPSRTICPTSFSRPMCFFDSLMILVIRSNRSDFSNLASLNPASFSK